MDVMDRRVIIAEIFNTLTKETKSLEDLPEWRSRAAKYLEHCLSLYPDGKRKQDFDAFIRVALFFNTQKENWDSSFFDKLASEDIVAGFKILYAPFQVYKRAIGFCLSEKLKRFFHNSENLKTYESIEPRFAEFAGVFKDPANISRENFNGLVEYVRNLPEAGRDRRADVRYLIQLWQTARDVEDVFAEIMKLPDEDFAGIAFDILQSLAGAGDYHNKAVACLKNYADKKLSCDTSHSAIDCIRLSSICSCLFHCKTKRKSSIDVLRETAENVRIDSRFFLDVLFKVALAHDPLDTTSTYLFATLYILLRQETSTEELPRQIQFLTVQCAKRDFFSRDKMHFLIIQLLRDAETDTEMILRHPSYIQQVVWLTELHPDIGKGKEAVSLMSRYYVLRRTTGARYHLTHVRILLRLLQSLTSTPRERAGLVRDIQRFYEEDSLSCPTVPAHPEEIDVDEKAKENAVICRRVIEMLKGIKMYKRIAGAAAVCFLLWPIIAAAQPLVPEAVYDFDGAGRIMTLTKPDGAIIRYEYDSHGRLTAITAPDVRTEYRYDKNGNCIEVRNNTGKTVYTYDPLDRLIKVTYDYPVLKKSVIYEYDPYGHPASTAVMSGAGAQEFHMSHDYDLLGRLKHTDISGLDIRYEYEPMGNGQKITQILPNGLKSVYSYGRDGNIQDIGHYLGQDKIVSPGLVSQIGDTKPVLDKPGRLKEMVAPKMAVKYDYSAEGYPIGRSLNKEQHLFVPDPLSPLGKPLLMFDGQSFRVDPVPGLSLRFKGPRIEATVGDGFGNPGVRLSLDKPHFKPASMGLTDSGIWRIESINNPLQPKHDFKTPLDNAAIKQTFSSNIFDSIGQGMKASMPSSAEIERRNAYWKAGQYWQNDAYYADPGLHSSASLDDLGNWPRNYMQISTLVVAREAVFYGQMIEAMVHIPGGSFIRGFLDRIDGILDEHMRQIGDPDAAYLSEVFFPKLQTVVDGTREIRGIFDQVADRWRTLQRITEGIRNSVDTRDRIVAFTGKPVVSEDYALRQGQFKRWPLDGQQLNFGIKYITESFLNMGKLYEVIAQEAMGWLQGQARKSGQDAFWKSGDSIPGINRQNRSVDSSIGAGTPALDALSNLGTKWQPKGVKFDKPAEFFGKIGAISGVHFDPETNQLSLIGDGNPLLPSVRLDDFIVALKIVYGGEPGETTDPIFSLDPEDPANPAGDWLLAVYGPDNLAGTHMGEVMFKADWVLKQYTFGVIADEKGNITGKRTSSLPGYKSYMELLSRNPSAQKKLAEGNSICSRFWILPLEMKLAKSGNTLVFVRSTMQVETRRMEMVDGRLEDNPDNSDPVAEEFAQFFTAHYDELAREAPVLEEVREAAKVVAIVKWLKQQGVGINDFKFDYKAVQHNDAYVKRIHSLSITAGATWGMSGLVRLVGGVELSPHPLEAVSTTVSTTLNSAIGRDFNGPDSTAVSLVQGETGRFVVSSLPITQSSADFVRQHPVVTQEDVTYAFDNSQRAREAFDTDGNSVTFEFGKENSLTGFHFSTPQGWELHGALLDSGRKYLRLHTPNSDDIVYDFRPDGYISGISVNNRPVSRFSWGKKRESVEIEHLKTIEEFPIGDISAEPKQKEKVVSKETILYGDNTLRYTRQNMEQTMEKPETISYSFSKDKLAFEIPGVASAIMERKNETTVVEKWPDAKIMYEYNAGNGLLKRISYENGDSLEFFPEDKTGNDMVVLRVKKENAVAEMVYVDDRIITRNFKGIETVYHYKDGLIREIDSPSGKAVYHYDDQNRLSAVSYPDGSGLKFTWSEGANVNRLEVYRQKVGSVR